MSRHPIHVGRTGRAVILGVVGLLFLLPIASMLEFTFRDPQTGGHSLVNWDALFSPDSSQTFSVLSKGLSNSLLLVVVTLGLTWLLIIPTVIYVSLGRPRLARLVEFLCLIPLSLPAVVLVVGYVPIYQLLGRTFGTGTWTLAFAYGITVLPFVHRALASSISASNLRTLSEANRTLGGSGWDFFRRIALPTLRGGLSAATVIAVAVVLGEFTIASLLNRTTLQTALNIVNWQNPFIAVALSLLSLALVFVLLFAVSGVGRATARPRRSGRSRRRNPSPLISSEGQP